MNIAGDMNVAALQILLILVVFGILSESLVIKDALSLRGVAQCMAEVNSRSKMITCWLLFCKYLSDLHLHSIASSLN